MITTTHPNNRYSIEKLNQKYRVFKSNYIDFKNPIFKIFPKPGEIVLAGNFRVGYTDTALKITSNNSDMIDLKGGNHQCRAEQTQYTNHLTLKLMKLL